MQQILVIVVLKLDVKKEKMKNLIPAKIGIYSFLVFIILFMIQLVNYNLRFSDNGTKSWRVSVCYDLYYCLIGPSLRIYGFPSIQMKNYFPRFYTLSRSSN